ncbi:uncharacterized protein LOC130645738 [Hydractinia symbiolongicarpus]|uniref:uncharacterized protein LOC130645738 n=1 Tax=Hydractinia symbiolongicarpus TaxID=13093 RepID=UPI00254B07B8|nr:uncharacterized protein LOC130645738 [Hydractinia symbiolongicarpus]
MGPKEGCSFFKSPRRVPQRKLPAWLSDSAKKKSSPGHHKTRLKKKDVQDNPIKRTIYCMSPEEFFAYAKKLDSSANQQSPNKISMNEKNHNERTTRPCEAITRSTDNREINVIAGETDDVPSLSLNHAVQSRSIVSDIVVEETKSVIPETQPANDFNSIIDDLI